MQLTSNSFNNNSVIPIRYAFGKVDPKTHVTLSDNVSPHLAWSGAPPQTRSFALICHDPDVPNKGDDVNQEGKSVSKLVPRVDFFHWVLIDIPADRHEIAEGSHASGVTPRGKNGPTAPEGMRHGINDYTSWFAGDADMKGDYYGYDGPCPPWNDEIMHHYVFTLYALDVEKVDISGPITGQSVREAIKGHILDQCKLTGLYTLNPQLSA
ncbi:MAG: YbhB/YbcL family Raf kinase inhibitor-like protein [Oceanospirillaceae bacterium]|nr:YbhB/YbcL family Raf kinase inhibitor-like protein [Oceanospirillaceae bacterium]